MCIDTAVIRARRVLPPGMAGERTVLNRMHCTAAAAHRRDHHHAAAVIRHAHVVEVIHLGHRAVTVCHDCESDSGFLPERDAEAVAHAHRIQTAGDAGARLGPAA